MKKIYPLIACVVIGIACFNIQVNANTNLVGLTDAVTNPNFEEVDFPARQMEYLDRGLVGVKVSSGVFLSWRSLGTDDTQTEFELYRDGALISTTPATNYLDTDGSTSNSYVVKAYANGVETDASNTVTPWPEKYLSVQLNQPAGGTTPDGVEYTYTPNDCSVGDLDGDGEYEIIVKWDPSNSKDNSQSGYTGNVYLDAYKINGTQLWRIDLGVNIRAGAHYTQFMVYDLDGDGIAEIACKTAPGTMDGQGNYVLMNSDSPTADYRTNYGYILSGPEYFTVFNGTTGAEMATVAYEPGRGTVSGWGDSYGNRVDRFLAAVAYLDGERPSVVMCRGYYTRTTLVAYDYRDGVLTKRWMYDSGTSDIEAYGQGNHNLSVADVDGDGKDEIIYGACAIDHDGSFMYRTGLGHGDAMHLTKIDPDLDGLQVFAVHESSSAAYGYEVHDAATGEIMWGTFTGNDNGRGLAADIDPTIPGLEVWSSGASGIFDCKGNKISDTKPASTTGSESINFRIYWDGDLQDELLDRSVLTKWNWTTQSTGRLETLYNYGATTINGTKSTPCLSADMFGDWREEIIMSGGSDKLIIFTTTIPTGYKLYTLMHDPVYRLGIAWQNVAYNQPPHLGFYIGDGLDNVPTPNIYTPHAPAVSYGSLRNSTAIEDIKYAGPGINRGPEAYAGYDGTIYISSADTGIQSVAIYSINGTLLHQNNNIAQNQYTYKCDKADKLLVVKVTTAQGTKAMKVLIK